jgi:hypothetical protein
MLNLRSALAFDGLLMFTVLFLIPFLAFATPQNTKSKPDLSGTWKCVESPKHSVYAGSSLTVVQNDPEIKMSLKLDAAGQENVIDLIFYSDGRGETNVGNLKLKRDDAYKPTPGSVTNWDGRKLVTKYSLMTEYREPSGAMRFGNISTTDTWELSKDSNKLTQTRTVRIGTINGSRNVLPVQGFLAESKYVYIREP